MGSVVARSPGKAYVVLLSHQLEAIQEGSEVTQHEGSSSHQTKTVVSLPSPLRILLDRAHGYHMAGDFANQKRCIEMIISISKQDVLPDDPLAVAFKMALEDRKKLGHGYDSGSLEQMIVIHGSKIEEDLQHPEGSVFGDLKNFYHRALDELSSRNAKERGQLAAGVSERIMTSSAALLALQTPISAQPGTLTSLYS